MTGSVLIGNSDNKLTQEEWSLFCFDVERIVQAYATEIYFNGGSQFNSKFQNYCIVFKYEVEDEASIERRLVKIKEVYKQDFIALAKGESKLC